VSWSHAGFAAVAQLVTGQTGLAFPDSRQDAAEAGMRRAMARAGLRTPDYYRQQLETDAGLLDDLFDELTVGETYFFREPAQFEFLRREVLPEIRRRRGPEAVPRLWSAGCASGEEAYSLAILCAGEGLAANALVLATDLSRAALDRARRGIYGPWSLRDQGAAWARPYLSKTPAGLALDERIRERVTFAYLNLAQDAYPSLASGAWEMDLILCRNVLIYFDRTTVERVAGRLLQTLVPGGWLVTASSDPPLGPLAQLETVVTDTGVFYRRPSTFPLSTEERGAEDERFFFPSPRGGEGAELRGKASLAPEASTPSAPTPLPPGEKEVQCSLAKAALDRGDYRGAAAHTAALLADPAAAALHVRAWANLDARQAEQICAVAAQRHPLYTELHYLHAILLLDLGRDDDAVLRLRQVLFLAPALATAHGTLAALLARRGDRPGARRAYRNVLALCASRPAAEIATLSDGEPNGRLAELAAHQLALLEGAEEKAP
jgi:chemotaxis protein methyltransferase CheR